MDYYLMESLGDLQNNSSESEKKTIATIFLWVKSLTALDMLLGQYATEVVQMYQVSPPWHYWHISGDASVWFGGCLAESTASTPRC